ncbi:MAG: ATP-dependent DNA helicase, partial [Candidatus Cloacimonetes bacterium]|nr:ATP-dependent DNA helicase [Candidatus Cloacimonadota bacterium]
KRKRNISIESLQFPFSEYRKGQRRMAVEVYKAIKENTDIFIQAPTGIGKTLGVIFPSLKIYVEKDIDKIFFLTAKTSGKEIAQKTFNTLREKNLSIKTVTLTAKEKICINHIFSCNSEDCVYAKNYYDKLNSALHAAYKHDNFDRELIERIALQYQICPFELSLDLSLWADVVICDYNYVYDPTAYLKRYFNESSGNYIFLADEAHNMVDRSREMFSAQIMKKDVLELRKSIKGQFRDIDEILNQLNKELLKKRKELSLEDKIHVNQKQAYIEILSILKKFVTTCEKYLIGQRINKSQLLVNYYFEYLNYLKIADIYNEGFTTYFEVDRNNITVKQFCIDPSEIMKKINSKALGRVFFSASLLPKDYYTYLLGGNENSKYIELKSPFPQKNFGIAVAGSVSTKYKDREYTLSEISQLIRDFVKSRKGNYFIYFPSYQYLALVKEYFMLNFPDVTFLSQTINMNESERDNLINIFRTETGVIAFAVMGGVFAEGIDLVGESLIGSIIVSVGLPQICYERDLIKIFFSANSNGFEYAYRFPGMNRVLQAAGRVIRDENDKGFVLLIDKRFLQRSYRSLMPEHWRHFKEIYSSESLTNCLTDFWERC